jgi:predicted MPP superfamily phosphohydrolase
MSLAVLAFPARWSLQFLRLKLALGLSFFAVLVGLYGLVIWVRATRQRDPAMRGVGLVLALPLAVFALLFSWAHFIEPDWVQVPHEELHTAKLPAGTRVRIVQVSDLHVDGPTRGLAQLPAIVSAQDPDVLIFSGDAADSLEGAERFRQLLGSLPARLGRYGVRGNHGAHIPSDQVFGGGAATELDGQPVSLLGGKLWLCGARYLQPRGLRTCLEKAGGGFHLAVFHSPDLIEAIAPLGPDLYLAGHTHGGQVRLPYFGALITFSNFDKKYEMGRYLVDHTVLYVNRGIGSESGFPRVRFLCRPEVTVFDLVGTG